MNSKEDNKSIITGQEQGMYTTIIFAHPWHGSFNKAILDTVIRELERQRKDYRVIDLYKDGFNPVMQESDLAIYSKGQTLDPLVKKYQRMLDETDELIFIFPIWWFNIPAVLKGFFDKVMLKNFAYTETSIGLKGKLNHITKTTIFSTSEFPTIYVNLVKGNPIKGVLIKGTLKGVGLRNIRWFNSGMTTSGSRRKKEKYLAKAARTLR
jgi:NAD(P)H dehydrogenase (quinone)